MDCRSRPPLGRGRGRDRRDPAPQCESQLSSSPPIEVTTSDDAVTCTSCNAGPSRCVRLEALPQRSNSHRRRPERSKTWTSRCSEGKLVAPRLRGPAKRQTGGAAPAQGAKCTRRIDCQPGSRPYRPIHSAPRTVRPSSKCPTNGAPGPTLVWANLVGADHHCSSALAADRDLAPAALRTPPLRDSPCGWQGPISTCSSSPLSG